MYPNLVLFKYDQVNSPMDNPVVQECRGIILDEADDWRVIARPFTKFYNYGEPNAASIDWTTARVQEKVDGSLCAFYHYKGDWHVATTGTPDAGRARSQRRAAVPRSHLGNGAQSRIGTAVPAAYLPFRADQSV